MPHHIPGQAAHASADGRTRQGRARLITDHCPGQRAQEGAAARVRGSGVAGIGVVGAAPKGRAAMAIHANVRIFMKTSRPKGALIGRVYPMVSL